MTPNKQVLSIWFKMLRLLRNEWPLQQIIVAVKGYSTKYSTYGGNSMGLPPLVFDKMTTEEQLHNHVTVACDMALNAECDNVSFSRDVMVTSAISPPVLHRLWAFDLLGDRSANEIAQAFDVSAALGWYFSGSHPKTRWLIQTGKGFHLYMLSLQTCTYTVPSQDTMWSTGGMRVTDSEEKGVMTLEREWEP